MNGKDAVRVTELLRERRCGLVDRAREAPVKRWTITSGTISLLWSRTDPDAPRQQSGRREGVETPRVDGRPVK